MLCHIGLALAAHAEHTLLLASSLIGSVSGIPAVE